MLVVSNVVLHRVVAEGRAQDSPLSGTLARGRSEPVVEIHARGHGSQPCGSVRACVHACMRACVHA
eukprot:3360302-Alexandrium_andersonii.AAC.1